MLETECGLTAINQAEVAKQADAPDSKSGI